jgi:hypothetical protein
MFRRAPKLAFSCDFLFVFCLRVCKIAENAVGGQLLQSQYRTDTRTVHRHVESLAQRVRDAD